MVRCACRRPPQVTPDVQGAFGRLSGSSPEINTKGQRGVEAAPDADSRNFDILDGEVRFTVGAETANAVAGDVVHIPRGNAA